MENHTETPRTTSKMASARRSGAKCGKWAFETVAEGALMCLGATIAAAAIEAARRQMSAAE